MLLCGKPFQAMVSAAMCATIVFWYPAILHAQVVIQDRYSDRRFGGVTRAIQNIGKPSKAELKAAKRMRRIEQPEPAVFDDPRMGANGTVFRTRG